MRYLNDIQKDVCAEVARDLGHLSESELLQLAYVGLAEEVGEVMGLHKRQIRRFDKDLERATKEHLVEEIGDVLWYLVFLCNQLSIDLEDLWDYNRRKLRERYGQ